jgi:hypothetical protein
LGVDMKRERIRCVWVLGVIALLAGCSADEGGTVSGAGAPGTGGASAGVGGTAAGNAGNSGGGAAGAGRGGASAAGGSTSAGAGAGGSVASGPTLNGLSADELAGVCADVRASFLAAGVDRKNVEVVCRLAGLYSASSLDSATDADLQRSCLAVYDPCLVRPREVEDYCAEDNADCSATVAAFEACVEEYPTYLDRYIDGLPACDALTRASLESALAFEPEPTPSCDAVWDQCGGTF